MILLRRGKAFFVRIFFYFLFLASVDGFLVEYQGMFASLGRNITFRTVQIRDAQRDTLSDISENALRAVATTSSIGRTRTMQALDFIEAFNGNLTAREETCLDEARAAQLMYAHLLGEDISRCNYVLHRSLAVSHWEEYFDALRAANQLAKDSIGTALVVVYTAPERSEQRQLLQHQWIRLQDAWLSVQNELRNIIDRKAADYVVAMEQLPLCLNQALFFFNYTIEFVKQALEECFRADA
uniref:Uncharacterized protein n=1 Tax=Anopheles atroparvus TaxID=41427 RepID=A0A182JNA6_ANOAO